MDSSIMVMVGAWMIGAFVNGITGIGGAIISLPLISLALSSKSVVVISLITGTTMCFLSFLLYGRHINVREVAGFWLAALPGLVLGAWTLKVVDMEVLQMLLAVLIATDIVVQLLHKKLGECMAPRDVLKYVCGFVAGFFGGSLGANGPIMAIYASLMCKDKDASRAFFSSAMPSLLLNISFMSYNGLVTEDVIDAVVWVLPAAVMSFALACPIARRIRQEAFRKAMLIVLGVAAVSLFLKSAPYFFG